MLDISLQANKKPLTLLRVYIIHLIQREWKLKAVPPLILLDSNFKDKTNI